MGDDADHPPTSNQHQPSSNTKPTKADVEELLTQENLLVPSKLFARGSMLWRNQAGPAADWIRHGDPTGPWFGFTDEAGVEPTPFFTNLFVMAIPKTHSQPYVDHANLSLHPLGLVASGAPNSICIKSRYVDKALPLQYLADSPAFDFSFDRAVAFGDNPGGNDAPLASSHVAMPFFSVSKLQGDTPAPLRTTWVGGHEYGTAAAVELLLEGAVARPAAPFATLAAARAVKLQKADEDEDEDGKDGKDGNEGDQGGKVVGSERHKDLQPGPAPGGTASL